MSQYETVLTPDVTSTDITLDDAVDGYEHNFTLQYILTSCGDITAPVTTATFSFGKKGNLLVLDTVMKPLQIRSTFRFSLDLLTTASTGE